MVKISKANECEANEIKELLSFVWIDTYKNFFSEGTIKYITEKSQTVAKLQNEIKNNDILFFTAKSDSNKIVGLATAEENDEYIFIKRLYIHPDYQRNGIGTKLLLGVLNSFENNKKLRLEVEKDNSKGLDFYRKNGFNIIEEKEYNLMGDIFNTFLMEKCS